jgi:hypothetical protein
MQVRASAVAPLTSESAIGLSPYTGNVATKYNEFFTGTDATNIVECPQSVGAKIVSETNPGCSVNVFANPAQAIRNSAMISTCQENKHFSLHSPEDFEARGRRCCIIIHMTTRGV